jgi:hypothetical protein
MVVVQNVPLLMTESSITKTSCKYPIRRVEVKVDTVPRGNMHYVQDNMFLGQLPKRLVIGCVDKGERAITPVLLEVTSPAAVLTGMK